MDTPYLVESWHENERKKREKILDKNKKKKRKKNRKEGKRGKRKHEMLVLKSDYSCAEHII